MQINILNNSKKLVGSLDTNYGEPVILNDKFTQYLDTGAYTLEFDAVFDARVDSEYADKLQERNYLVFQWHDKTKLFQIQTIKDTEGIDKITRNVYAVTCSLELYQTQIRPTTLEGTLSNTATAVLQDTNFKVGRISPQAENLPGSLSITSITAAYTVLQNLVSAYGDVEIEIRVECINAAVGQYEFYIDFYYTGEVGNKTYNRIEYDWNEFGMTRETDTTDFYSGLIAQGANGITFANIEWNIYRGDPMNKPLGQDYLVDPELHAQYNNGGKYILGAYNSDATTPIDLLWETYYKLKEVKQRKLKFAVPLYITQEEYYNYDIGDTVHVVNPKFNPPVELEARIGTLVISFTDPNNCKATLSNYKEVKAQKKFYSPDDIVKDAVSTILGLHTGKLSEADKAALRELMSKLNYRKEESDKVIEDLINAKKEDIPQLPDDVGDDTEDYSQIKINNIDGGLWIGDKRIYDIKQHCVATIPNQPGDDLKPDTKAYQEALQYYSKFNLGKLAQHATIQSIRSSNNKYKIPTMVKYWAPRFGLDPEMVYMCICGESSGDPYQATSYSGGGYGLMQCERDAYFNIKQTIKFIDGSTTKFTPSYSTMKPGNAGNTTISGVTVDKNINNQIMFGCYEMRTSLDWCHNNIFATLISFNMGIGAVSWIVNKYVCTKYGFTFTNSLNMHSLPAAQKSKIYEVLESGTGDFADYRKAWVTYRNSLGKPAGTVNNIELYLRWYNINNGQLPYSVDYNGKKYGLGVNTPAVNPTTPAKGSTVRDTIVTIAKKIVSQHVDQKIATYDQGSRTVDFDKPNRYRGTIYGIKNPICYDCSSLVSCAYLKAGMKSVYAKSCAYGTLVAGATAKSGYKMFKITKTTIEDMLPGDIIMMCNKECPTTLTRAKAMAKNFTHHTLIYCGKENGKHMVAHARKWDYWPKAIMYMEVYSDIYKYGFCLRPYELVEKDKLVSNDESTGAPGEIIIDDTAIQNKDLNCITIKALPGATATDYLSDYNLISNVTIGELTDDISYPITCDYVFIHFGIPNATATDAQDVINMVEALKIKYPKTPIFVAEEWHATSLLSNYTEINKLVDEYNLVIENYCNKTDYAIFLDIGDIPGTSDGYTCDTKEHTQTYFNNVKSVIKNKVLGYKPSQPDQNPTSAIKVDYVLQPYDNKDFGTVGSIYVKCLSNVDVKFWAKFKFRTNSDSEPTRFTQSTITYLEGDDCKSGALIPKADTEYQITVMANPDRTLYQTKKYYGVVTAVRGDGNYTDCGDFIGRDKIIEIGETYWDNRTKFVYNTKTPLSFTNPYKNRTKWKDSDGKFHIDCSTFVALCCKGIPYNESPYAKKWTSRDKKSSTVAWSFNPGRTAADIAKYCVAKGWVAEGIDTTNWTNVEKGDLIFWDRDGKDLNRFMSISHAGICSGFDADGDATTLEVTTVTNAVYKRKLKDNKPGKVVLVCRIRKDG